MGYWEEKRKYEELKEQTKVCTHCGKQGKMKASCQHISLWNGQCGTHLAFNFANKDLAIVTHNNLCEDCAHKCKKCGKHFCPKHITNHNC